MELVDGDPDIVDDLKPKTWKFPMNWLEQS